MHVVQAGETKIAVKVYTTSSLPSIDAMKLGHILKLYTYVAVGFNAQSSEDLCGYWWIQVHQPSGKAALKIWLMPDRKIRCPTEYEKICPVMLLLGLVQASTRIIHEALIRPDQCTQRLSPASTDSDEDGIRRRPQKVIWVMSSCLLVMWTSQCDC